MSIHGITNLNQYAAAQMAKTQLHKQAGTAAMIPNAVGSGSGGQKAPVSGGGYGTALIEKIPQLEQYEDVIARFLSGESELENPGSGKPLTEDQIALRGLMREYQKTDTRTIGEIAASMQKASKNFLDHWQANGNGGPPPARILSADGSFKIIHSKEEKNTFLNRGKMDFLQKAMEIIQSRKSGNATGFDMKA